MKVSGRIKTFSVEGNFLHELKYSSHEERKAIIAGLGKAKFYHIIPRIFHIKEIEIKKSAIVRPLAVYDNKRLYEY